MYPLETILYVILLLGSIGLTALLSIIYKKNYRFATMLFDLLPYYPSIVLINIILKIILGIVLRDSFQFFILIFVIGLTLLVDIYQFYIFKMWKSNYLLKKYGEWLKSLQSHPQIHVIDVRDWIENPVKPEDKTLVLIRHDVDINLERTRMMFELEVSLDIPSCYYFRNNAERFSFDEAKLLMSSFKSSEITEIGFHYETISNANGNLNTVSELFREEIEEFREFYPELKMISAHGDKFRNRRLVNQKIVDLEKHNLISSYDLDYDVYISEIGGNHHHPVQDKYQRFFDRLEFLRNPPKGQLVQVLVHADWWF